MSWPSSRAETATRVSIDRTPLRPPTGRTSGTSSSKGTSSYSSTLLRASISRPAGPRNPIMTEIASLLETYETLEDLAEENQKLKAENRELRQKLGQNRKRLTPREVADLRRLYRTTGMNQTELAAVFDINPATVSRIVRGIYH